MARQTRAEQTRARLLEATIASLSECGHRGTSTQEVCRRAGVSRGTLLHHFPTRIDLLVGSLDAILNERVARFLAAHPGGKLTPRALIRSLWAQWQGPVYVAWLELAVAARTEPALTQPMAQVMARFDAQIQAAFEQLVDLDGVPPDVVRAAPFAVFALFNGLSVGRAYESEDHAEQVVSALETVVGMWSAGGMP